MSSDDNVAKNIEKVHSKKFKSSKFKKQRKTSLLTYVEVYCLLQTIVGLSRRN